MGFICPRGPALHHPFEETLLAYAHDGCKVHCGKNWSTQQIEALIARGAHVLARSEAAAKYAWKEA